jgi:acyl carrier protein
VTDDVDTLTRIRRLIGTLCSVDPGSIRDDARLLGFGFDSIQAINLLISIEEEFSIQLELEHLRDIKTVRELAEYIDGRTR